MLIKYWDRLTLDGVLALNAFWQDGSRGLLGQVLKLASESQNRENDLKLPGSVDKAFRVKVVAADGERVLALEDTRAGGHAPLLCVSPYSHLGEDPAGLEEFLASDAHQGLAFTSEPLVCGIFNGSPPSLVTLREGRSGRKYARTAKEVVDFLKLHPAADSVLFDVTARTGYARNLETVAELEVFMAEAPDANTDFVLDAMQMTRNYLFAEDIPEHARFKGEDARMLELDPASEAVLDLCIFPREPSELASVLKIASRAAEKALGDAEKRLSGALESIHRFALEKRIEYFPEVFGKCRAVLAGSDPVNAPPPWDSPGISPRAARLMTVAIRADQFAGMGSWNDLQIEKTAEYTRVSNELCLAILEGVTVSATHALGLGPARS